MKFRHFLLLYALMVAPAYAVTRGGPGQPLYHPVNSQPTSTPTATVSPTPTVTATP